MSITSDFQQHAWPDFKHHITDGLSPKEALALDAEQNPSGCKNFTSSKLYLIGDHIRYGLNFPAFGTMDLGNKAMDFPFKLRSWGFTNWRFYRYALAMRKKSGLWTVEEFWRYSPNPRSIPYTDVYGKDLAYRDAVNAVMYYETQRIWELWRAYLGQPCKPLPDEAGLRRYFETVINPTKQDIERQKFINHAEDAVKPSYGTFPHVLRVEHRNQRLIMARNHRTASGVPLVLANPLK